MFVPYVFIVIIIGCLHVLFYEIVSKLHTIHKYFLKFRILFSSLCSGEI